MAEQLKRERRSDEIWCYVDIDFTKGPGSCNILPTWKVVGRVSGRDEDWYSCDEHLLEILAQAVKTFHGFNVEELF